MSFMRRNEKLNEDKDEDKSESDDLGMKKKAPVLWNKKAITADTFNSKMHALLKSKKDPTEKSELSNCIEKINENTFANFLSIYEKYKVKDSFVRLDSDDFLAFHAMKWATVLVQPSNVGKYLQTTGREHFMDIRFILPKKYDANFFIEVFKKIKSPKLIPFIVYKMELFEKKVREDSGEGKYFTTFYAAPTKMDDRYIIRTLAKIAYPDVANDQNIEDAMVLFMHKKSPHTFSEWLSVKNKAKSSDALIPPESVFVDGHTINIPKIYLIKLKDDDPRQAVLGDITGYCQSLGSLSVHQHVEEDTSLKEVGILIIAKDNSKRRKEKGLRTYLSSQCKDDDIVGFIRACSDGGHYLILDVCFIKSTQKINIKKYAQIIAKFAHNFLLANPRYVGVIYGNGDLKADLFGFLRKPSQHSYINHPLEMRKYESQNTKHFREVCMRDTPLYAEVIYNPERVLQLTQQDLVHYNLPDILNSVIQFGNLAQFKHILNLLNDSDFKKCHALIADYLASINDSLSVMSVFLDKDDLSSDLFEQIVRIYDEYKSESDEVVIKWEDFFIQLLGKFSSKGHDFSNGLANLANICKTSSLMTALLSNPDQLPPDSFPLLKKKYSDFITTIFAVNLKIAITTAANHASSEEFDAKSDEATEDKKHILFLLSKLETKEERETALRKAGIEMEGAVYRWGMWTAKRKGITGLAVGYFQKVDLWPINGNPMDYLNEKVETFKEPKTPRAGIS